jgi:tetratricopeptide (TPR) repeat protein
MEKPPFPIDLTALSFEETLKHEERLKEFLTIENEAHGEARAETFFEIGVLRHRRGQYVDAARAFIESAETMADLNEPLDLIRALVWASESFRLGGRLRRADAVAHQALHVAREQCEEGVPMALSNLAMVRYAQGALDEAYGAAAEAVKHEEALFGRQHPRMAVYLGNLLAVLVQFDRLDEAKACAEQILAIEEEYFDPNHPRLASAHSSLALVLTDLGELGEARRHLLTAIDIDRQSLPPDHPVAAIRLNNLAHIDLAEGDLEAACQRFRHALTILSMHFEENHPDIVAIRESMAYAECAEE